MNRLLLLHELLNMVNKDKWAEIYNLDHYFNIKLYDYNSLEDYQEISKITNNHYKKIFLWMPTFRVGISDNRSDSTKIQKLGIPLFNSITDLRDINDFLKNNDNLLIIKLHPRQKIDKLITEHFSNIIILTGDDAKKLNIDNYKLLKNVDALISDYSSIVYTYEWMEQMH